MKWLLDDVKIDYAFNYKKLGESTDAHSNITKYNNDISSELKRACPNGIDLYFDNVGGKHLEAAIDNMSLFGRIVLCGATSVYDSVATTPNSSLPSGPSNLSLAISNRLRLQGFVYSDHNNLITDFYQSMSIWISEDKIGLKETIYDGLETAPKAFVGLFTGENIGRTLVRIG